MKITLIFSLLCMLCFTGLAQSVEQNFNSGNRTGEACNCWYTPGCSIQNNQGEVLEGSHSLKTGPLNGGRENAQGIISPWMKMQGTGLITFQHRLTGWENGTTRIIAVVIESATTPVIIDTIYRTAYSSQFATTTQFVNINIPAFTANKIFRIKILAYGIGGNSRCIMDKVAIRGDYWSSPAQNCNPIAARRDNDNDGVSNDEDQFPNDANRAYVQKYPATGNGTLLFEDLWPANGDNDFNDIVIHYNYSVITNAANKVVEVKYNFIPKAIGGSFRNGFAFQLDGISPNKIIRTIRNQQPGNLFQVANNGTETAQSFANFPVFSSAQSILLSAGGGIGVNINPAAPFVTPDTLSLTAVFIENGRTAPGQTTVDASAVNGIKFNPYLIINGERGKEIHGADKKPTSLASLSFFNTSDDRSNALNNRYYRNRNNLPWLLNIPETVPYTQEGKDITSIYLKLNDWALSSGATYNDWYKNKPGYRNTSLMYPR